MGQHREQHVVLPAGILAHFIVRHPELRFPFLKTWFDRPPDAAEPGLLDHLVCLDGFP